MGKDHPLRTIRGLVNEAVAGPPYLSLTLPGLPRYAALVADPSPDSFSPLRCSQMDQVVRRVDWAPPETLALLKAYVCERRPD